MRNVRLYVCILAASTSLLLSATTTKAQSLQQVPTITAQGNFNSGVTDSSTRFLFTKDNLTNYPLRYTDLDSVVLNAPDTITDAVSGLYNSVGYGFDVTKIAGRTDSFTIKIYGTKKASPTVNDYKLLTTLTIGNASTYTEYDINSGNGNPYTKYMFVFSTTNAALLSQASWRGWALTR